MNELKVDPERLHRQDATGIYVRATLDGEWGAHDVATLTKASLDELLDAKRWDRVLLHILLGHPRD